MAGVRWLWVILGVVAAEIALIAVSLLFSMVLRVPPVVEAYALAPICLAVMFLTGLWIAGRARSDFILNGALVGLIGALVFLPLLLIPTPPGAPQPPGQSTITLLAWIDEGLKIVGGVLGGAVAGALAKGKRASPAAAS